MRCQSKMVDSETGNEFFCENESNGEEVVIGVNGDTVEYCSDCYESLKSSGLSDKLEKLTNDNDIDLEKVFDMCLHGTIPIDKWDDLYQLVDNGVLSDDTYLKHDEDDVVAILLFPTGDKFKCVYQYDDNDQITHVLSKLV